MTELLVVPYDFILKSLPELVTELGHQLVRNGVYFAVHQKSSFAVFKIPLSGGTREFQVWVRADRMLQFQVLDVDRADGVIRADCLASLKSAEQVVTLLTNEVPRLRVVPDTPGTVWAVVKGAGSDDACAECDSLGKYCAIVASQADATDAMIRAIRHEVEDNDRHLTVERVSDERFDSILSWYKESYHHDRIFVSADGMRAWLHYEEYHVRPIKLGELL